jgi:hypothetical protein
MNKLWAAALACLCTACASTPSAPGPAASAAAPADSSGKTRSLYSATESASLFGCSALTDSAMIIAEMKQKGMSLEQAKAYFAARPNSELTLATADLVYDAAVGNVWDYATKFFGDCAASVSKVPRSRSGPASFCMLNSMIAANAQASKQAGVPIEKVESYFAVFPGDTPKAIITRVYSQSQTRAAAHAEAWNACMAQISG